MQITEAEVLFRPETPELRFLPEGPYTTGPNELSWVAIQHGPGATSGSVNILNTVTRLNRSYTLPGRPGFAFPTDLPGIFVVGAERSVGMFDTHTNHWTVFADHIDSDVSNTIINDGVLFEDNLIFGCKDLAFQDRKAGLYLWRRSDQALIRLRDDQICSNGKAVFRDPGGELLLLDIDSPDKTVTRSVLDIAAGTISEPEVVIDLTSDDVFPDGMIATPDHRSVIIAMYDPGDPGFGAARQYRIADGQLEAIWTCAGSPRLTCPQLVSQNGQLRLLLTSAVEHMTSEQQQRHPNAGCLFIADTRFTSIGDQPVFTAIDHH